MTEIQKTSFRDWTLQQLEDTFGLRDERSHPAMVEWLKFSVPTEPRLCQDIEQLRAKLDRHARGWNEEELKLFFRNRITVAYAYRGKDGEDIGKLAFTPKDCGYTT